MARRIFVASLLAWSVILCTDAFPEASVNSADDKPAMTRCPGGFKEGEEVEMGHYWYKCQGSELVPKGCITDQKERLQVGQTYDNNKSYRLQCVQDSSGDLRFAYKSCVYDGREHAANDQWEDGKYWYTCQTEGDYLRIVISGCVDEGRRVELDGKVTKGSFVYQCKRSSNGTSCSMCPVACTKNGREYQIGDTFVLGDFLYTCTNTDSAGPIVIKPIGCAYNDQHLKDGDHYFKNDAVYECTVRKDEVRTRPVGCVQRDGTNGAMIERRLDCYWTEGTEPYQYQMTCKLSPDSKTAVKVPYSCIYKLPQGAYTIAPGCYTIADKSVISCEKDDSSSNLYMRAHQIDDIGQLTAKGLKNC